MPVETLLRSAPPTAVLTNLEWRGIVELEIRLEAEQPETRWTHLRGTRMRTAAGFFDEAAAALQFPIWFGANWDAFIDIARDRSWLAARILTIYDAHLLLVDATDKDRRNFAEVTTLCNRFGKDEDASDVADDDTDGFHLLCQVRDPDHAAFVDRWRAAGLSFANL
jgi:hypothetical protein